LANNSAKGRKTTKSSLWATRIKKALDKEYVFIKTDFLMLF